MIRVTKKYRIYGAKKPYTHSWDVPDCVTVISSTILSEDNIDNNGTSYDVVEVTLEYCDLDCLQNSNQITLNVVDADNCDHQATFTVNNDCDGFNFSNVNNPIQVPDSCTECTIEFQAATTVAGGSFTWTYDENVFEFVSQRGDILTLTLKSDARLYDGQDTEIQVKATYLGCDIYATYTYNICIPTYTKQTISTFCVDETNNTVSTGWFVPNLAACPNTSFDWTEAQVLGLGPKGSGLPADGGTGDADWIVQYREDAIKVTFFSTYDRGLKVANFIIADCRGIEIREEICFNIGNCDKGKSGNAGPVTIPYRYVLGCEDCTDVTKSFPSSNLPQCNGDVRVDLDDYVVAGDNNIDWSTFTFILLPGQTLVSASEVQTPYATVTFNSNHEAVYVATTPPPVPDIVKFSISDSDGNLSEGELTFTSTQCGDAPVLSDQDICLTQGTNTGRINLLSSTQGDYDPSTFVVTNNPSNVTLNVYSNGEVKISAPISFEGTDSFQFQVSNLLGAPSNTATVNIEVRAVNEENYTLSVCNINGGNVNLTQVADNNDLTNAWYFSGFTSDLNNIPGTSNGTFVVNSSASSTYTAGQKITTNSNLILDLTNAAAGVYVFQNGKGSGGCDGTYKAFIEVVSETEVPSSINESVCITTGQLDLSTLINQTLPTGEWSSFGDKISVSLSSSTIDTTLEGAGVLQFRFTADNAGIYNETACTSSFIITLTIEAVPETLVGGCITLCSNGDDPVQDPECQGIGVVVSTDPTCEVDLYDLFNLPSNASIELTSAPLNPITLVMNGTAISYASNSIISAVSPALWQYGNAPLGSYQFTASYGGSCQVSTIFEIQLTSAACDAGDATAIFCNGDPVVNLVDYIDIGNCNVGTVTYALTTSSNDAQVDLVNGTFNPSTPGVWVISYTSTVGSDGDPDCTLCETVGTITFTVYPLPGPGVASPGSLCNNDVCVVPIYPGLFVVDQSQLGVVQYNGYSSTYVSLPTPCAAPLSSELNEQLIDTVAQGDVLTSGSLSFPSGQQTGFYYFTNTVTDANGCSCSSQTVIQVVAGQTAGTGQDFEYCNTDPILLDLDAQVSGYASGGTWSVEFVPDTQGQQYDNAVSEGDQGVWIGGDQAYFNGENQPTGTYTFRYSKGAPPLMFPLEDPCSNCSTTEAVINVLIVDAASAGQGESGGVCS